MPRINTSRENPPRHGYTLVMGMLQSIKQWNDAHKPLTPEQAADKARAEGGTEEDAARAADANQRRRRAKWITLGAGIFSGGN